MENKTIEALEKLLQIKEETIKELEKQIQLLKNQPPVVIPQTQPLQPVTNPWYPPNPWSPGGGQPWYGSYIVTSGSGSTSVGLTGDPLPLGSIQMGCTTFSITDADGTTNIYDSDSVSHIFSSVQNIN